MQRQSTCARSHCSPLLSLSLFSLVSMHGFASRDSGSCLCADAFHRLLCSRGVARSAWYNNRRANIRPQAARSIRNGTGNWLPDRFSWAKIHNPPSPGGGTWTVDVYSTTDITLYSRHRAAFCGRGCFSPVLRATAVGVVFFAMLPYANAQYDRPPILRTACPR